MLDGSVEVNRSTIRGGWVGGSPLPYFLVGVATDELHDDVGMEVIVVTLN